MAKNDNDLPEIDGKDAELLPSLRPEARRQKVWGFRIKGVSVASIAQVFGVSEATIYEDLKQIGQRYRDELLKCDGVAILADNLHWLDEMERIALYETNQAETSVVKTVDEQTGKVREERIVDPNRGRFFQAAIQVRTLKLKLLTDAGIIPKGKSELFSKLEDSEVKVEKANDDTRTPEEIADSINKLMKFGRLMPTAQAAFDKGATK